MKQNVEVEWSLTDAGQPRWAAMAEWLRRLTRNQMGSSRVGSNPTCSDLFTSFENNTQQKKKDDVEDTGYNFEHCRMYNC